jgi:NTE family protein
MQVQITESRLLIERPEILLRPPLSSVRFLEFDRAEEMITIGYRSALGPLRELARRLRHSAQYA